MRDIIKIQKYRIGAYMKNKFTVFTVFALVAAMLLSFCACTATPEETKADTVTAPASETETKAVTEEETTNESKDDEAITPEENSTVSLLTELMTEWSKDYERGKLDDIFDYSERCEPVPVHFSWEDGADYTHLLLSTNPDMSDPAVFLCNSNELDVEDLLPGTVYYWQTVKTKDGENIRSDIHCFNTLQTIRTVYIPGVSNVRDLGGKLTKDGKRVKYGIAFRGADFAHLTAEGKSKAVDILGIKTELDLREKINNGRSSLGKDIKYICVTAPYYTLISSADYKDALIEEIKAFTDPDNFPIYFHCSLGRDRTGTLAFILLALLGVDENDIYMDYEASFFSDMGGYVDNAPPSTVLNNFEVLKRTVSTSNANLQNRMRKTLLRLGLTESELDAICANMLEDVK